MPSMTRCTFCQKETSVPDGTPAGTDVRCPSCRKLFKMATAAAPLVGAALSARAGAPAGPAPRPAAPTAPGLAPKPNSPSAQGVAPRPIAANPPPPAPAPAAPKPAAAPASAAGPRVGASVQATYRPLLEAVSLSARAHKNQLRKDDKTPYAAHPFRVLLIVRHAFGIDDAHTLIAAALHDTLEDTTTDWDDIGHYGEDVGNYVAVLTKDKRRPEAKREEIYKSALTNAPWQVQVCKLADIFDNLMDANNQPAAQKNKSLARARDYLAALATDLKEPAKQAHAVVTQLLGEVEKAG